MNSDELKKKIVEVVLNSEITGIQIRAITGGYSMANNIADALIAAGIGDVKSLEISDADKEQSSINYYCEMRKWKDKCKEAEQIAKERDELKVELRSKVDYIYEQDEIIKDYKHRAKVAEKAGRIIQHGMARVFDVSNPRIRELIANMWNMAKLQAEKELMEEKK